jgi:hypothetical protein
MYPSFHTSPHHADTTFERYAKLDTDVHGRVAVATGQGVSPSSPYNPDEVFHHVMSVAPGNPITDKVLSSIDAGLTSPWGRPYREGLGIPLVVTLTGGTRRRMDSRGDAMYAARRLMPPPLRPHYSLPAKRSSRPPPFPNRNP